MTIEDHVYEKCAECHLFVEPNDSRDPYLVPFEEYESAGADRAWGIPQGLSREAYEAMCAEELANLAEYIHLHRGDDADEELDASHAARPSGQRATLDYWREHGPAAMRARFIDN